MSQPVETAFRAGYKTIGGDADSDIVTTSVGLVRLGGANGYMETPMWADSILGIYAHAAGTIVTDDEEMSVWGYINSADGMSIKPFEFLYPPCGCAGGTPSAVNSTKGEYYPMNAPVRPGSRIINYAQSMAAYTGVIYPQITFLFSNSRESGVWAPTSMDPRPGIQRYRIVGEYTASVSYADGYAFEAGYQVNLGAGGGVITELGAMATNSTNADSTSGIGTFQFTSNDVPLFPQTLASNAYGPVLGATSANDGRDIITRRVCHVEGEALVHFINGFLQGGAQTATAGDFITMIEFIRGS